MRRFENGNAEQDDLWGVLNEEATRNGRLDPGLTIKSIMDTWTLQNGYPVVHVERNYQARSIKLTQRWFLLNPLNKVSQATFENKKWYVPFTYTTSNTKEFDFEQRPEWLKPDDYESEFIFRPLRFDLQS